MDEELLKQMQMLENLNLGNNLETPQPLVKEEPIETVETLLGEVPFGSVTKPVAQTNTTPQLNVATTVTPQVGGFTTPINTTPQKANIDFDKVRNDFMNQAPVFVNLEKSIYKTKTDFLNLKDGEKTRVTLANLNFIRHHIHFIDGLGKIRCNSIYAEGTNMVTDKATCCKFLDKDGKEQKPKHRLLIPVFEYPVVKADGKTLNGTDVKLKMWDMNYMEEKQLLGILEEYKMNEDINSVDITSFDLSLTKGKTGDYSIITLVSVPSWRAKFNNSIQAENAKITNDFYNTAYKESARAVTEASLQNSLNQKQEELAVAQQLMNQQIPTSNDINLNI